jgi:ABC-type Co2+ transport system permease subunit
VKCPKCACEIRRARLLTSLSGRITCPQCHCNVRARLDQKMTRILALTSAQAVVLSSLWIASPILQTALFIAGGLATVAIGLEALFAFELSRVE